MCASYGTRWRAREDRSPRATPRRPLRSLDIGEPHELELFSFRLSLLVVSLSLCVSLSTRVSSLTALCFRPCRRFLSAIRLAGSCVLHSSLLSTLLPSVSFLRRLRLSLVACPSTSPTYIYEHFNQLIELASFLACLLI